MSVEEDNRQEWTFTLYDFDNNGKVTREVIITSSENKFEAGNYNKTSANTTQKMYSLTFLENKPSLHSASFPYFFIASIQIEHLWDCPNNITQQLACCTNPHPIFAWI